MLCEFSYEKKIPLADFESPIGCVDTHGDLSDKHSFVSKSLLYHPPKMMNDNSSVGVENNSVSIRIFHPIKIIQIFIKVGKMAGTQGYK